MSCYFSSSLQYTMQKIAKISKNKANKKAIYRSIFHNHIFIELLNKKSTYSGAFLMKRNNIKSLLL